MAEIFTVTLPDIGEGVIEGEVIEWLKEVGDAVDQDEPVVVVMTDKATVELPAPAPGMISKHYFRPGEISIKDKPLYDIEVAAGASLPAKAPAVAEESPPQRSKERPATRTRPQATPSGQTAEGKALATPGTRRLAQELGIDINEVTATGPHGRVTADNLRDFLAPQGANKSSSQRAAPIIGASTPIHRFDSDERIPVIGVRNYIAEKMVEASYLIPSFSYFETLDAGKLFQLRSNSKAEAAKHGVKLTFTPYFVRALSLCISKHPEMNASFDLDNKEIVIHKRQNIGIAMKTHRGVIVPVLKDVQEMSFHELIRAFEELKERALNNKLSNADMQEATLTLSNFGTEGGVWATPIINYPEVVILGLARIQETPAVYRGELAIRKTLNCSWCADHRVLDGHMIAEISNTFASLIQNPARLL